MVALLLLTLAASPGNSKPSVKVHIESDDPRVELRRGWDTPICRGTCDVPVLEPDSSFFLAGDGITESPRFNLDRHGSSVTLQVRAGTLAQRRLSNGLLVSGAVLTALSALLIPALSPYSTTESRVLPIGGLATGLSALGGGVFLRIYGRTRVDILRGPEDDEQVPQPVPGAAPGL